MIEITDAESRFEYVNAAFERISGYSRADALGETPFSLLMSDRDDEPHYRAVQNAIASGQVWHGTLTGRRKDGTLYEQEATISPVRDAEGVITHYVAVKRDITERLQTQARIWHLAHHDALLPTGSCSRTGCSRRSPRPAGPASWWRFCSSTWTTSRT